MTKTFRKTSLFFAVALAFSAITFTSQLTAGDRCFGCAGKKFVQYTGKADNAARKKAADCGCKVTGTTACPSNKKQILCTVN
jgi:hypothetical protein